MTTELIHAFAAARGLPPTYGHDIERWLLPLLKALRAQLPNRRPFVLGINGCQGSGKSTLSALIVELLDAQGLAAATVSLDDFYLGRLQRQRLAKHVHPLLLTRGVPGTHDVDLALTTLRRLQANSGEPVALPRFDKATDEPLAADDWPRLDSGALDVLILEGWCLGARAQRATALETPCNALERNEDPDSSWRGYVNERLGAEYQTLFALIDHLLLLQAPSFDCVEGWRNKQEQALRERVGADAPGVMSEGEVARFVQHFERVTRHCLATLPAIADTVFALDESQRIIAAS